MGVSFLTNRWARTLAAVAFLAPSVYVLAGCSPRTTGAVKDDVSLTEQTKELEAEGIKYSGPMYTVAILAFENKTPSKNIGVGQAATDVLRTLVKKAGLDPITLTDDQLKEQEQLIKLQQSGALKTGRKNAADGYESVDFRVAGAVTSYAELEESSDMLVSKSKTRIARVQVDYALVDVATGSTLVADSGMGEYKKKTGGVLGFGSKSTEDVGLREGALRDALTKAMTKMVARLNEMPFRGSVLAVDGDTLVVKAGTRSRLSPGSTITIHRPGDELIDPDTGRVIGKRDKKIGEAVIKSHEDERISEASVKSGADFKVGDTIKAAR